MTIAKRLFSWRALSLLAAAMMLTALPRPGAVLAGSSPEEAGGTPGAGAKDAAAAAVLELDSRDEDLPQSSAESADLSALLAEAGPGSKEFDQAVEELNETEVDVEESAAAKESAAPERESRADDRLERETERDEREIDAVEKETESGAEPGEDDKGDAIEKQDPGMDD